MIKNNIDFHKIKLGHFQQSGWNVFKYVIVCSLFLNISCNHNKVIEKEQKEEEVITEIHFQIYNMLPTGSTTVSDIAIVNGKDSSDPSTYPYIVDVNGGEFITTLQSNSNAFVLCDVILVIQNLGNFRIEITNSPEEKMLVIGKNKIMAEGSLSFDFKEIQWYIKTTIVDNSFSVLIILNTPEFLMGNYFNSDLLPRSLMV